MKCRVEWVFQIGLMRNLREVRMTTVQMLVLPNCGMKWFNIGMKWFNIGQKLSGTGSELWFCARLLPELLSCSARTSFSGSAWLQMVHLAVWI